MGYTALLYGLYRLTNRNDETTTPSAKVDYPDLPDFQPDRHVQNISIIPSAKANINDEPRDVYIASRVVMGGRYGGAVGMFEKYAVGALKDWATDGLTKILDDAPDPFHHWCVVVGDYIHQLQSTSLDAGWNYYTNEKYSDLGGWTSYKIGSTNFNDIAIRNAAAAAMNETPEVYNYLENNCQHYALRLLDKILRDGRKKMKMLNQHYGEMVQEPIKEFSRLKVYKIGEEPPAEDNENKAPPNALEPVVTQAKETVPELDDGEDAVVVNDRNGAVAVVESEVDHMKMIEEAVAIMIQNTQSIKEGLVAQENQA